AVGSFGMNIAVSECSPLASLFVISTARPSARTCPSPSVVVLPLNLSSYWTVPIAPGGATVAPSNEQSPLGAGVSMAVPRITQTMCGTLRAGWSSVVVVAVAPGTGVGVGVAQGGPISRQPGRGVGSAAAAGTARASMSDPSAARIVRAMVV